MDMINKNKIPFSWVIAFIVMGLLLFSILKDRHLYMQEHQDVTVSFSVNRLIPTTHVIELDDRLISGFSILSKGGSHVITSAVVKFADGTEEKVYSIEGLNYADQKRVFKFPHPEGKPVDNIVLHSYAPRISEPSGLITLSISLPGSSDVQVSAESDFVHVKF